VGMSRRYIETCTKIINDVIELLTEEISYKYKSGYFEDLFENKITMDDYGNYNFPKNLLELLKDLEETFLCKKEFLLKEIVTLQSSGYTAKQFGQGSYFKYDLEQAEMKYLSKSDMTKPICTLLT
jgi:hypothetical protein